VSGERPLTTLASRKEPAKMPVCVEYQFLLQLSPLLLRNFDKTSRHADRFVPKKNICAAGDDMMTIDT